jgi:hypothetical protein
VLNDLIEVTGYSDNGGASNNNNNSESKSQDSNSSNKETNTLMIKAEKLTADSIVKCIKKLKCAFFCVSSSRKVASLLSASKNRVKIFELEVEDEDDEIMEQENDADEAVSGSAHEVDNESSSVSGSKDTCKVVAAKLEETTFDEFNMPTNKPVSSGGSFYAESNKFESTVRQFSKQKSAGSTCSIANSICSSTAATIGSMNTSAGGTSSVQRNKRKKNFEEDDEDDDTAEDLPFTGDTNSDIASFKTNFTVGDHIEIVANQDGSQQLMNNRDN